MDERYLAAAAANGDQQAFTILVERYRPYIYTIAYKIALHEDDALDITQNVLVRLVEKIGNFNGRGAFRSWLAAIAANEASDFLKRPSRREVSTEPEILEGLSDARQENETSDPRKALDTAQRRRLVEAAMASLSPQQRAIFALRLREDMGPAEIAEQLGLPPGQVRSQLHRAIARIREMLTAQSR